MRDGHVPRDYDDLYTHYFADTEGWCAGIIRRFMRGHDESVVEDLLHDCWMRMHRLNLIERFEPHRANFGLLVFAAVRSECLNHLEKIRRRPLATKEYVYTYEIDESDRGDPTFRSWTRSPDFHTEATQEDQVEAREILAQVEEITAKAAAVGETARDRNIGAMVDMLARGSTAKHVAETLGVCNATVSYWRKHLEEAVAA